MKIKKIVKDYATSSSGRWCNFKYDYSYFTNSVCNSCLFCYKNLPGSKLRRRSPGIAWGKEVHFNKYLFKVPITVSRYCDPFINPSVSKQSLDFAEYILKNGGMISFISPSSSLPDRLFELMEIYNDSIQYQIHVFSDDSIAGNGCRDIFAPNFCNLSGHEGNIKILSELGIKTIIKIDPIIIGVNDLLLQDIINYFKSLNCYNFILRQVFATPTLKERLSLISRRYAMLLSEQSGKYYTYTGEMYFDLVSKLVLDNTDCVFTFCQNSWMNKLVKAHKNCCQFDKAEYIFNENFNNTDKINFGSTEDDRLIKV